MSAEITTRIAAAKQAVMAETALLLREFGRAESKLKSDGTRVTAVDIAISQNIQRSLHAQFPGDQFFSEELTESPAPIPVTSRFCWMLDPVDGTNNYTNGIPYVAISLALLEQGTPVYGVIYDLARRVLIHGGPGRGVWDGDHAAHARREPPHGNTLIGFHSPVEKSHVEQGRRLIARFKIRGLGSSALHLAYTAIGLLDGVVEHNNKVWDIAAAVALLPESGAEIHYMNQSPFPLREFTVSAPRIEYIAGNTAVCHALLKTLATG